MAKLKVTQEQQKCKTIKKSTKTLKNKMQDYLATRNMKKTYTGYFIPIHTNFCKIK